MKKGKIIQICAIASLACLTVAVNVFCLLNSKMLNNFAYINNSDVTQDQEVKKQGSELAKQIEGEGSVLVKNDGILPLDKASTSNVNVFGWSSTQWVYSGSGSGRVNHIEKDFIQAMNEYGIETNTKLTDFYTDFLNERPLLGKTQSGNVGTLKSYTSEFSVLYEPSIDSYSQSLLDECEIFSDTAIVVLSRVGGESSDAPKYQKYSNTKGGKKAEIDNERTYLDISADEEDLLSYVSETYDKTIVLYNGTNPMNLEFLTRFNVDACLVVGATGMNAASAIPDILYGEINPSGRLSDTYAYSFDSNPAYWVSGPEEDSTEHNFYSNTKTRGYYPNVSGVNNGNVSDNASYPGCFFVDYTEDIYIGYKWYETADAEGYFNDVNNEYGKGYDGVVQFPFGYGLSYTNFTKNIESANYVTSSDGKSDYINIKVKVKNTGNIEGKEVVQLYVSKPYKKGGIEKSSQELVSFSKTASLKPGVDELVELNIDINDLYDYDDMDKNNNGFKGYELEKGEYLFTIRDDSHHVSEGDNTYRYNLKEDKKLEKDPVTGEVIENRLSDSTLDGFSIDGHDSDQNITYLSRSDFKTTFPTEDSSEDREMSDELLQSNLDQYSSKWCTEFDSIHDDDYDDVPLFGEDSGLKVVENDNVTELGLALGKNYDDEQWDAVLNQVTLKEAQALALHGYTHMEAVDSIGKPQTREVDGPHQAGSFNVSTNAIGYPNATVLAQTFNKELSYQYGKQLGTDAKANNFDGLYAAGINLHRNAFGGRNYEYFSEDPFLTGEMSANEIKGGMNAKTYFFMKHFIAYEQETYRDGVYTWMTERNLRMNYIKPFVMAIRKGGLNGIMTSYNRIGSTWTGGSYSLIHELLEKEIGYKGAILTDYSDHRTFMNGDQSLRAGGSVWMDGYDNKGSYLYSTTSKTYLNALREATKRNIYQYLNTAYVYSEYLKNGDDDMFHVYRPTPYYWWRTVLYSFDGVMVVGLGCWLALTLILPRKKKEN